MIRPMLLLGLPEDNVPVPVPVPAASAVAVGVTTLVMYTVSRPELPETDLILVPIEVTGVVGANVGTDVGGVDTAEEGTSEEDAAAEERVGELALGPLVASPVTVEIVGFEEASFEPTVAYATPSWRLKNGRGSGFSWQQSTLVASALQHH
jgi:hypothetical protein